MNNDIISIIIALVVLAANCTILFQMFPSRFKLHVSICLLVLFTTCHITTMFLSGPLNLNYGGLRSILYFPLIIFLTKGPLFQKLFAFFLELVLTISLFLLINKIVSYFVGDTGFYYNIIRLTASLVIYVTYAVLVFKNKNIIYEKLFSYGNTKEWVIYSFVGFFSFGVMVVSQMIETNKLYFTVILIFILLSFSVLCFAIINTHEKSKQKFDADFARKIISSGRDHYQKMDELHEKLRILRHDYKYHLNATRKMLRSGDSAKADEYLTSIEKQLSEYEFQSFCSNSVINALVASYAERCKKLSIKFEVDLSILTNTTLRVPNYELCIIFGNLLENAVEACRELDKNRKIELVAKDTTAQFMLMVRNSFKGIIHQENNKPASIKTSGGFGLRSVKTVAVRYGGDLFTEWNKETFIAYVTVRL